MFAKIRDTIASDNELSNETLRLLSLFALAASGSMSLFKYTQERSWWFDSTLGFAPTFISALVALMLVAPLYIRNILKWNKSIYSIISFFLILMVFASFVELTFLGGRGATSSFQTMAIGMAILLSWVGIRGIAGIAWMIVLFFGIYNLVSNNVTFGFLGFLYITLGAIGIILHSGMHPGYLVQSLVEEYSGTSQDSLSHIRDEVNYGADTLEQARERIRQHRQEAAQQTPDRQNVSATGFSLK